jgi:hypothetical protein
MQNGLKWHNVYSKFVTRRANAMGAAKAAEITQMAAITSLAHIFEGLALYEMEQNCTSQQLKICAYKIIFVLDVCMKYGPLLQSKNINYKR